MTVLNYNKKTLRLTFLFASLFVVIGIIAMIFGSGGSVWFGICGPGVMWLYLSVY